MGIDCRPGAKNFVTVFLMMVNSKTRVNRSDYHFGTQSQTESDVNTDRKMDRNGFRNYLVDEISDLRKGAMWQVFSSLFFLRGHDMGLLQPNYEDCW